MVAVTCSEVPTLRSILQSATLPQDLRSSRISMYESTVVISAITVAEDDNCQILQ
jgi:hypothetical protein